MKHKLDWLQDTWELYEKYEKQKPEKSSILVFHGCTAVVGSIVFHFMLKKTHNLIWIYVYFGKVNKLAYCRLPSLRCQYSASYVYITIGDGFQSIFYPFHGTLHAKYDACSSVDLTFVLTETKWTLASYEPISQNRMEKKVRKQYENCKKVKYQCECSRDQ